MPFPAGNGCSAASLLPTTQQYILQHLLQGRSDKEIANRLDLSAHTVDYHMRQLRRRFAARNRVQLVNAVQQGDSDFGVQSEMQARRIDGRDRLLTPRCQERPTTIFPPALQSEGSR